MNLKTISYGALSSRAKENYNFAKLSSILADYGYHCIRLSDDYLGADLLAIHIDGAIVPIQLKARFSIYQKYLHNEKLYIAAPINGLWYCYPHLAIVQSLKENNIYTNTCSFEEKGGYSAATPSQSPPPNASH